MTHQTASCLLCSGIWLYACVLFLISERIECVPDSSVGTATRYCLAGPWSEFRLGRDFPRTSRPALGLTQPPKQWVQVLSRGVALTTNRI